ncbi:MAG: chromosomal replication initiation protein DnaA, partial [Nocardioidaceae bacterium]|nr:chromosomal replication initiation protein DnaA [Nocardioidaceae bacterium]
MSHDQPGDDSTPPTTAADSEPTRLETEWTTVVGDLQVSQRAWLQASKAVTMHGSTAIVAVPDDFTRKRLEGRMRAQLEDALSERFGHDVQLAVTVDTTLQPETTFDSPIYDDHPAYDPPVFGSGPATRGPQSAHSNQETKRYVDMSTTDELGVPAPAPP